jgi:hypothetical protein
LQEAINKLTPDLAKQMENNCYQTAEKFSEKAFVAQIKKILGLTNYTQSS